MDSANSRTSTIIKTQSSTSESEMIYLDGSEVGLLRIHRLVREGKANLRSGDCSTTGEDMSAGVYQAEDDKDLYVKVGRANEGTFVTSSRNQRHVDAGC